MTTSGPQAEADDIGQIFDWYRQMEPIRQVELRLSVASFQCLKGTGVIAATPGLFEGIFKEAAHADRDYDVARAIKGIPRSSWSKRRRSSPPVLAHQGRGPFREYRQAGRRPPKMNALGGDRARERRRSGRVFPKADRSDIVISGGGDDPVVVDGIKNGTVAFTMQPGSGIRRRLMLLIPYWMADEGLMAISDHLWIDTPACCR